MVFCEDVPIYVQHRKLFSIFPNVVQCDQMVRLFYNIWPFAPMKISPTMSQICQSRLSILPNKKKTVKNLLNKLLPKWRNFVKSGHTDAVLQASSLLSVFVFLTTRLISWRLCTTNLTILKSLFSKREREAFTTDFYFQTLRWQSMFYCPVFIISLSLNSCFLSMFVPVSTIRLYTLFFDYV